MKLFKPQLFLIRKPADTGGFNYFIYSTTYFNTTGFTADGYEPFSGLPDENGVYQVHLKVRTHEDIVLNFISPVAHTVPLGKLSENGSKFKLEVSVHNGEKLVGKSVIDDMEAEDDGKPEIGKSIC